MPTLNTHAELRTRNPALDRRCRRDLSAMSYSNGSQTWLTISEQPPFVNGGKRSFILSHHVVISITSHCTIPVSYRCSYILLGIEISAPEGIRFIDDCVPCLEGASKSQNDGKPGSQKAQLLRHPDRTVIVIKSGHSTNPCEEVSFNRQVCL